MSIENGKVCCNCRHNIRNWDKDGCECKCEITGEHLSYMYVMGYWCRHWAKEKEITNEKSQVK